MARKATNQISFMDLERSQMDRTAISRQIRELLDAWNDAPGDEALPFQIRQPADAANLLMASMRDLEQEHLVVLLLNTKNRVIRQHTVYVGSVNTAMIRIAEVFREAVRDNAPAIVVAHNHPSGDPTPSPEDIKVTEQMIEAGKLLDITVLDHIVVGKDRFHSLRQGKYLTNWES